MLNAYNLEFYTYNPVELKYSTNHSHLGAHYMFSERVGAKMKDDFSSNLIGLPVPLKPSTRIALYFRCCFLRGFSVRYPDPVGVLAVGRVDGEKEGTGVGRR
jgi:hypothetical protein